MNLKDSAARHVLGLIPSDELPELAQQAITDGLDSPSLQLLAATGKNDLEEVRDLFRKALSELKINMPSTADAGLILACEIAQEVVGGRIPPYQGAKRIWDEIYTRLPELKQLKPFVGLASEYEDDVPHRDAYSHDIVEECKRLISG
jgi:hypothetical protein